MRKYSGIDLHSNNSLVAITDEADRVVYRARLPNDLGLILQGLEPHRAELIGVVVESTYNWYWLVDGLQEAGYKVLLANTAAIKQYEGLKRTGDEHDATHLAHLLRLGLLKTGYIAPRSERGVRDVARRRLQLTRSRSAHILAVENVFARSTGRRPSSNTIKGFSGQDIDALGLDAKVAVSLKASIAVIATLSDQIQILERWLREQLKSGREFALLKSVPGIGDILAGTIVLETGPIERFAKVGNFSSYCRCVDTVRLSNGKKKGEGNRRNGNKYLAWAFVEAANFALRFCPQAKRFYERKRARTNRIVALKALAHKLARACYHILREGKPFELTRCFA